MAYSLIPEGFTLKKVSSAEKDAVDEYFGRQRRGTYFEGLLSNPALPSAIALITTGIIAKQLAEDFKLPEIEVQESITKAVINPIRNIFGTKTQEELIAGLTGMSEAEILAEIERRLGIR